MLAVQTECSSGSQTACKRRIGVGSCWEADTEFPDVHAHACTHTTHTEVEIAMGDSPAGSGMLFGDELRLNPEGRVNVRQREEIRKAVERRLHS